MGENVICFGQQPNGFFPKRFFVSKIWTAKRLQAEIGGRVVFFYHDSDHDPRETTTKMTHRKSGHLDCLNFAFENKAQRKYTPLYLKRVSKEWQRNMARQLPNYVSDEWVSLFSNISAETVADFCLEMYRGMGLLEDVELARSSDAGLRKAAIDVDDFFVDAEYQGEVVRARRRGEGFALHQGGDSYSELNVGNTAKDQVSPTRDTRLLWMQSVVKCTHYVAGASEIKYMNLSETPEIEFVERDPIDSFDEAFIDI